MIKSVPVAANKTAKPRYKYGISPKVFLNQRGSEIGLTISKSCIAPSGQADAQKIRPQKRPF